MLAEVRQHLASAIADEKSYNVPALCVRLGLQDGTIDDAHRSKSRYAQQRLMGEPAEAVLRAARDLLSERDHYDLAEAVAKIDDLSHTQITPLTRRRLVAVFDGAPLSTELDQLDLLRKVWPIDQMPSGLSDYTHNDWTLEDRLFQHTVRNDDMTNREILGAVGVLTCSQVRLFAFLQEVVGPETQTPQRQAQLAGKINEILVHDGYRLVEAGKMSALRSTLSGRLRRDRPRTQPSRPP